MAFGMKLGGDYGKLLLSLFRIGAVGFIGYYLYTIIKANQPRGLIISISLILSGALGNIVDSVFYGVVFSDSAMQIATFMPQGGGYSTWFHGRVVDMFYFPVVSGFFPDWVPFWGGEYFQFFRPVFNIADAAITMGVFLILAFQRSFFLEDEVEKKESEASNTNSNTPLT
jgi:signal peptidase II